MIRWGLILAVVIIAAGAWFDWTYHAVRMEVHELRTRLESRSDRPSAEIKADCARAHELQSNLMARMFKPHELAALAKRCDAIEAQGETSTTP
jgi:hypothetical protein